MNRATPGVCSGDGAVHDGNGQILAIGHIPDKPAEHGESGHGQRAVIPIASKDQFILETSISDKDLETLHQTHFVDIHKCILIPKASSEINEEGS